MGARARRPRREPRRDLALFRRQLPQQVRADGEQVAAREVEHLRRLAEARAHDLGPVAGLLEVLVDAPDRGDAGVLLARDVLAAARAPVPVVDPPDERRYQRDAGVGAGRGLHEAEQQRQVAVDPLALELLRGADALPGARDLDQHALAPDAGRLVATDEATRPFRGRARVEAQARLDLRRDAAGHALEDLAAEGDEQRVRHRRLAVLACASRLAQRLLHERAVARVLRGLEDQARVGGGVARPIARDGVEIARVGDDDGVARQGLEQVGHRAVLSSDCPRRATSSDAPRRGLCRARGRGCGTRSAGRAAAPSRGRRPPAAAVRGRSRRSRG